MQVIRQPNLLVRPFSQFVLQANCLDDGAMSFKLVTRFKSCTARNFRMSTTYADAGVDLSLGDEASKVLFNAAKLTWENRKGKFGEVVEVTQDFSGLRAINVGGLPPDSFTNLGFDGVGTKMELAERLEKHDTIAYDLF